jgi:hypothetical protein
MVSALFLWRRSRRATDLARHLAKGYPHVEVAGAYSPPFRPLSRQEDLRIIRLIEQSNADVLLVASYRLPSACASAVSNGDSGLHKSFSD